MHDVYGIGDVNPGIHTMPNGLVEWPLATVRLLKTRFPFGGGGYLRLYPLTVTSHFIESTNRSGWPCMLYIHPYEVGPIIPEIKELSAYRRFRHYYNCSGGGLRLKKLLRGFHLCTGGRDPRAEGNGALCLIQLMLESTSPALPQASTLFTPTNPPPSPSSLASSTTSQMHYRFSRSKCSVSPKSVKFPRTNSIA